jgi:hypothetical protein
MPPDEQAPVAQAAGNIASSPKFLPEKSRNPAGG